MTEGKYEIIENTKIAADVFKMHLSGDTSALTRPGQFVNIKITGYFLRRPISVCDYDGTGMTLIYKTVGGGTEKLSEMPAGHTLDLLVGLGNGYDTSRSSSAPLLIGGGVGVPPLYGLAKRLLSEGKKVTVLLGFNRKEEIFLDDDFRKLGAEVHITTADGSVGTKGFVTDAMNGISYSYFYTCGPMPMMRAIAKCAKTQGQYSFEERMGCGFGACMGCSCKTMFGTKKVCTDGPVFESEEIIWQT